MIVEFIPVDVVGYFSGSQGASKFRFQDEYMLKDISLHVGSWMESHFDFLVSILDNIRASAIGKIASLGTIYMLCFSADKSLATLKASAKFRRLFGFRCRFANWVSVPPESMIVALAISVAVHFSSAVLYGAWV